MDTMQTFFPMDMGMQADGLSGGAPVTQAQGQQGSASASGSANANANAFAGDGGSNVFMGVSEVFLSLEMEKGGEANEVPGAAK